MRQPVRNPALGDLLRIVGDLRLDRPALERETRENLSLLPLELDIESRMDWSALFSAMDRQPDSSAPLRSRWMLDFLVAKVPDFWSTAPGVALLAVSPAWCPTLNPARFPEWWAGFFRTNPPDKWLWMVDNPVMGAKRGNTKSQAIFDWAEAFRKEAAAASIVWKPGSLESMGCLVAHALTGSLAEAEKMIASGVTLDLARLAPVFMESRLLKKEDTHLVPLAHRASHALFGLLRAHFERHRDAEKRSGNKDVNIHESLLPESCREAFFASLWALCLKAGAPLLSDHYPVEHAHIARLEFAMGGMRRPHAMRDWLRLSWRPWPYPEEGETAMEAAMRGGLQPVLSPDAFAHWLCEKNNTHDSMSTAMCRAALGHVKTMSPRGSIPLPPPIGPVFAHPFTNPVEAALRARVPLAELEGVICQMGDPDEKVSHGSLVLTAISAARVAEREAILGCIRSFLGQQRWEEGMRAINRMNQGFFHLAMQKLDVNLLEEGVRLGLDIGMKDQDGNTPGHWLARKSAPKTREAVLGLFSWLGAHGCNWEDTNVAGETVLDISDRTLRGMRVEIEALILRGRLEGALPEPAPEALVPAKSRRL
jgi:hypothetical protein